MMLDTDRSVSFGELLGFKIVVVIVEDTTGDYHPRD